MLLFLRLLVINLALVVALVFAGNHNASSSVLASSPDQEYSVEYSYVCQLEMRAHEKFLNEMSWPVLGIVVDTHALYRGGPLSWNVRLYERGVIPLDLDVSAYFTRSNTTLEFNYFERILKDQESPVGGVNLVVVPFERWETIEDIVVSSTPLKEHDFVIRGNLLNLYLSLVAGSRPVQFCY